MFKLDTAGHVTALNSFTGSPDRNDPGGQMTMDAAGNLYSTTFLGGSSNLGIVFKLTTPAPVNNFTSFTAQVVVTTLLHGCRRPVQLGQYHRPTSQAVTLSVAGANLAPPGDGNRAYSGTVWLTIGAQSGSATVNAHVF